MIYQGLGFFKESLICTKKHIVEAVRGFLSTKNRFYVENQWKSRALDQ